MHDSGLNQVLGANAVREEANLHIYSICTYGPDLPAPDRSKGIGKNQIRDEERRERSKKCKRQNSLLSSVVYMCIKAMWSNPMETLFHCISFSSCPYPHPLSPSLNMEIAIAVKIIDKCTMQFLRINIYTIEFFFNMDFVEFSLLWHLFMTDICVELSSGSILKSVENLIARQNSLIPGLCKCSL